MLDPPLDMLAELMLELLVVEWDEVAEDTREMGTDEGAGVGEGRSCCAGSGAPDELGPLRTAIS